MVSQDCRMSLTIFADGGKEFGAELRSLQEHLDDVWAVTGYSTDDRVDGLTSIADELYEVLERAKRKAAKEQMDLRMAIDQAKTDIVRCHKQLGVAYYEGQSLAKDSMTLRDQFSLLDSERRAVAAKRTERVESLREVLSLVKKLNNALGDGARTEEVSANDSDLTMARFDRLTHAAEELSAERARRVVVVKDLLEKVEPLAHMLRYSMKEAVGRVDSSYAMQGFEVADDFLCVETRKVKALGDRYAELSEQAEVNWGEISKMVPSLQKFWKLANVPATSVPNVRKALGAPPAVDIVADDWVTVIRPRCPYASDDDVASIGTELKAMEYIAAIA